MRRLAILVRLAVIILGLAQIVVAIAMAVSAMRGGSDAAGNGMMAGFAMVAVFAVFLFGVPALIMAAANKALKTALVLALIFPAGFLYVFGMN